MSYIGKISANLKDTYGFIDLSTVLSEDGSPHGLNTTQDIFISQDDCDSPLRPGMEITFYVKPDRQRKGAYRANHATQTSASRLLALGQGGIELHLQNTHGGRDPRELEHNSVFVSWCLSRELAREMKDWVLSGWVVKILFISWPTDRFEHSNWSESRLLVDPLAAMEFFAFNRGGFHRMVALLVRAKSESELKDMYLQKSGGSWSTDVISSTGVDISLEKSHKLKRYEVNSPCLYWFGTGYEQLYIPDQLFAKRPFDEAWLTWINKAPLKDSCDTWRRRILYAYHVQVLLILIPVGLATINWFIALFSVIILFSFGFFKIGDYSPLRYPLDEAFVDIWKSVKGPTFFGFKVAGHRVGLPLVVSPGVLVIFAFILWLAGRGMAHPVPFSWHTYLRVMIFLGKVWGGICLAVLGFQVLVDLSIKAGESAKEDERERLTRELETNLDGLVCSPDHHRLPDVSKLPLTTRTLWFRVLAHKQEHCQGYAKR